MTSKRNTKGRRVDSRGRRPRPGITSDGADAAEFAEETVDSADPASSGDELGPDDGHDELPHGVWPERPEDVEAELAECLKAAFTSVNPDALLRLLRRMPQDALSAVMRSLGMSHAARVNLPMARALQARQRTRTDVELIGFIFNPQVHMFNHAHLDAEQWAELLGAGDDDALEVLRSASHYFPASMRILAAELPDELEHSMLAAIALRSDEWVPALALLARIDERAQALYERLREENPGYPRTDRSFTDLGVLAAAATLLDEPSDADDDADAGDGPSAQAADDAHHHDTKHAEHTGAPRAGNGDAATDPIAAAETLDWEAAAVFAERVYAALNAGSAPDLHDLQEVVDFSAAAHQVSDALEEVTGAEVAATAADIAAAVTGVKQAGKRTAAFGPLTQVLGPAGLEEALQVVRDLAAAVLAEETEGDVAESLAALADLATLGREQRGTGVKEYAEIARLEAAARAALPAAALAVIPAAMFGDLDLGTSDAPAHPEPAKPAEPAEPKPTVEPAPEPEPEPEAALTSDFEPAAEKDTEPEPAAEPDDNQAADLSIAAPAETSTETPAVTKDVTEDEDDFVLDTDELDRFLASEAAGSARVRRTAAPKSDIALVGPVRNGNKRNGTSPASTRAADTQDGEATAGIPSKDGHEELRRTEAALLEQGRFGLASLLHADPAHAAARRLAAYQARLTSATGDLASAFADDQPLITRDDLGDDLSGQLLAWAAAARVSVLAPASAAHQVLLELGPSLTDCPALTRLGSELATASLNGAIAVFETSEDVAAQHRAAESVSVAMAEARELAVVAGQRSVKYAPANTMYTHWMGPDGPLGSLLDAVIADDHTEIGRVQAEIIDIRRNLDRFIDDAFQAVIRGPGKGRRVEHGARQKLVTRIDEVLTIAGSWADAATLVDDLRDTIRGAARGRRPLERLRQGMTELREDVFTELDQMRQSFLSGQQTDAAVLGAAAVAAATKMVVDTFTAVDGSPPQGAEPSPAWTVRGELLAAPISLDVRTLQANSGAPLSEGDGAGHGDQVSASEKVYATMLSESPAPSFQACYDVRRDRAEHDLTEVIVAAASKVEPDVGAALLVERDADVKQTQAQVIAEIDRATSVVNSARRNETLPETVWSAMLARLEALRSPQRRDFATIRAVIAQVTEVVDGHTADLVAAIRERVAERAEENRLVAAHRDRLMAIVDRGDVAGADEYLEQLTSGAELPETSGESKHLQRFFPQVAELVFGTPTLLDDLHDALAGKAEVAEVVQTLFTMTQTNPTASEASARPLGRAALGAWAALARAIAPRGEVSNGPAAVKARERSQKLDMDVTGLLKAILAALGYEFSGSVELEQDQPAGRRFVTVRSVSGIGKAMSPALGSHMGGPAGRVMRIMLVSQPATPRTLLDWLSNERDDQTVVVLYMPGALTVEQRRALAAETRRRNRPVAVVIDEALLAFIACQPEPSVETLAHLVLPFTASSPYRDTPGDTPPEMFYGRVEERRAVIDLFGSSFVSGGRQLGKSALLRSAEREFDKGGHRRAVWVDVRQVGADGHPEALWPVIASALNKVGVEVGDVPVGLANADSVSDQISRWLAVHDDRALLVLIDEADNFLTADAGDGRFPNVGACKKLMENERRRVKFVFAGLHRTSRFESLSNQPLAHMGKPTVVGPLRPQAAHNMIVRPLAAMGFIFDDPHAQTARIMAATNSVPSLLQLFGRTFIEHLTSRDVVDGPPQVITDADITAVLDDKDLADLFREKYILTLNLDHRYQVIVHAIALAAYDNGVDAGLRLAHLAAQCRQYWPAGFADLSIDYLRGLVTECCDLGLLTLESGRYRMRTPYVLRLLGTADEVAEVLYEADERLTLPSSLDAGSYRALVPGTSGGRAPLTSMQVGRLFEGAGQTHVVVGSDAMAARRAVPYLTAYAEEGKAGPYQVQVLKNWTPEGLRSAAERLTKPTMLVADMRTATESQVASLLAAQDLAHEVATAELIVVVVAGMLSVGAWLNYDNQLVELTRVDEGGLRLWCAESDSTFDTPEEWDALESVTGGWPVLVERALAADGAARTPAKRISDLRESLSSLDGARQFVAQCGLAGEVSSSVALAAVFWAVAEWTSSSPAAVDELVGVIDDPDLSAAVDGGGFASIDEALRCLALTGALVQVADRDRTLVAAESVLARAMGVVRSEDQRDDEVRVTADGEGRK